MEQNIEQQVTRGIGIQPPQQKAYPFPTEIISLPSKGLVYPESNPLSKGEITIKLMTAREEDIITNANLIRKGLHLDKLLEAVVVEPGVNINDLILGDKNAILVSTRILAFGPDYEVIINDPADGQPVDVTIDLSTIKIKEVDESVLNRNNEYSYKLPKSGVEIKFKLLTHGDEVLISKDVEASQKTLKQGNEITTRYRRMITEVNGTRDLGYISNFVSNQLLAADSKALRKYALDISPDLDLTFEYTSNLTGESEALRIPFGVDFFYPAD